MRSIKLILAIIAIAVCLINSGAQAQDEDWHTKGRKLLSQHRYDEAIEAFSTAIDIIPRDYQSYNFRGVAYALKKDFDKAMADYNKAIDIRPRYAEAYNNRGFAHTQTGNLKAALNDYTRALEINPFLVDAYNNKAWVLATASDQRIRNGGEAVRLAKKAVELKADINSMDALAAAHAAVGNFDTAVDVQRKAIQKLMLENKTADVHKYLLHLKSYRAQQALLIDYSARAKITGSQTAKASPKSSTPKTPASTDKALKTASAKNPPKPKTAPASGKKQSKPTQPAVSAKSKKTVATAKKPTPAAASQDKIAPTRAAKAAPPAKAQKKPVSDRKPEPVVAAPARKTAATIVKPLPYTIQISSFRDPQQSIQVARKLNTNGDPAFTSPVDISGKGRWYRVFVGNYTSLAEARSAADELKRRKFRYVNIAKKPYTVQIGKPIPRNKVRQIQTDLKAKGYFSYQLPSKTDPNQIRILIGAFANKKAAAGLVRQLTTDGFNPEIAIK